MYFHLILIQFTFKCVEYRSSYTKSYDIRSFAIKELGQILIIPIKTKLFSIPILLYRLIVTNENFNQTLWGWIAFGFVFVHNVPSINYWDLSLLLFQN